MYTLQLSVSGKTRRKWNDLSQPQQYLVTIVVFPLLVLLLEDFTRPNGVFRGVLIPVIRFAINYPLYGILYTLWYFSSLFGCSLGSVVVLVLELFIGIVWFPFHVLSLCFSSISSIPSAVVVWDWSIVRLCAAWLWFVFRWLAVAVLYVVFAVSFFVLSFPASDVSRWITNWIVRKQVQVSRYFTISDRN